MSAEEEEIAALRKELEDTREALSIRADIDAGAGLAMFRLTRITALMARLSGDVHEMVEAVKPLLGELAQADLPPELRHKLDTAADKVEAIGVNGRAFILELEKMDIRTADGDLISRLVARRDQLDMTRFEDGTTCHCDASVGHTCDLCSDKKLMRDCLRVVQGMLRLLTSRHALLRNPHGILQQLVWIKDLLSLLRVFNGHDGSEDTDSPTSQS